MIWLRKGFVYLLSAFLLLSLLGTAFATSITVALSHPDKLETWLDQSHLYDNFVNNAIDQAKKSANSSPGSSTVSLSDTAVQQAAETAFSQAQLKQYVN